MGKTDDLTVVQETDIDTLHKEADSKGRGWLFTESLIKAYYRKLIERRKCGRKTVHKPQG